MSALNRALWGLVALAFAFAIFCQLVALGYFLRLDHGVQSAYLAIYREQLHLVSQAVALLGGLEVTALVALGLFVYLRRSGFKSESWAMLVLPLAVAVEFAYKRLLRQPQPEPGHADGPSLSLLFERGGVVSGNSFPSGHMVRTVIVYGLLAFVIVRLAPRVWARWLALGLAAVMIALMAFDRLYLDVHWFSDVVGGLLLGGLGLAVAIVWLDRPRVTA
jgi:membrane-associated phospholipid phosphatase